MLVNSINQVLFGAKVKRCSDDRCDNLMVSKKNMIKSYNDQIEKLRIQKECQIAKIKELRDYALEVDEFVRSDEVKEIVDRLPNKGVVELHNSFDCDDERFEDENWHEYDNINTPYLSYRQKGADAWIDENASFFVKKQDGQLDKTGVKNWLESICEHLGV